MNTDTDTQQENFSLTNQQFVDSLEAAPLGEVKSAGVAGGKMIRRKLRENGFARHLIPTQNVSNADLTRRVSDEGFSIIEEMEPESLGAVSIPLNAAPNQATFRGDRFESVFHRVSSWEYVKPLDELRTYRSDLRQVVTDNSLRDMQTEEDAYLLKGVDRGVGAVDGVGLAGVQQNFEVSGQISNRRVYKTAVAHLIGLRLNNGCFLVNRKTALEFTVGTRDEIGGDLSQDFYTKGLAALEDFKIQGVPHLATIKSELVGDNVTYQFTEPGYLGRFYILEDVTMYVKRDKDVIRFSATEKISMTIANVAGIARHKFVG